MSKEEEDRARDFLRSTTRSGRKPSCSQEPNLRKRFIRRPSRLGNSGAALATLSCYRGSVEGWRISKGIALAAGLFHPRGDFNSRWHSVWVWVYCERCLYH